jgi:hypothetical protein
LWTQNYKSHNDSSSIVTAISPDTIDVWDPLCPNNCTDARGARGYYQPSSKCGTKSTSLIYSPNQIVKAAKLLIN